MDYLVYEVTNLVIRKFLKEGYDMMLVRCTSLEKKKPLKATFHKFSYHLKYHEKGCVAFINEISIYARVLIRRIHTYYKKIS